MARQRSVLTVLGLSGEVAAISDGSCQFSEAPRPPCTETRVVPKNLFASERRPFPHTSRRDGAVGEQPRARTRCMQLTCVPES